MFINLPTPTSLYIPTPKGAAFNDVAGIVVREAIGRFKYIEEAKVNESYEEIMAEMKKELNDLISKEAEDDD